MNHSNWVATKVHDVADHKSDTPHANTDLAAQQHNKARIAQTDLPDMHCPIEHAHDDSRQVARQGARIFRIFLSLCHKSPIFLVCATSAPRTHADTHMRAHALSPTSNQSSCHHASSHCVFRTARSPAMVCDIGAHQSDAYRPDPTHQHHLSLSIPHEIAVPLKWLPPGLPAQWRISTALLVRSCARLVATRASTPSHSELWVCICIHHCMNVMGHVSFGLVGAWVHDSTAIVVGVDCCLLSATASCSMELVNRGD
jgi:hypothetical protein